MQALLTTAPQCRRLMVLLEMPSFCGAGLARLAKFEKAERDARRGSLEGQVPRVTPLR